jgi:hypothetical protein
MKHETRICGATTKDSGEPCKRACIKGGTRCTLHGGNSPLARQAASETLAAAALPAARVLFDIIDEWQRTTCPVCGMPKGDPGPVIRAAQIVLDRTGFHPSMSVQVSHTDEIPPWARWLTNDQLRQVGEWIADAKTRMEAGADPEDNLPNRDVDAEDAVVIDDELADAERELVAAKQELAAAQKGLSPGGLEAPGEEDVTQ